MLEAQCFRCLVWVAGLGCWTGLLDWVAGLGIWAGYLGWVSRRRIRSCRNWTMSESVLQTKIDQLRERLVPLRGGL